MILRNETDFSNEELMDILHFADPDNLMKQTGIVFITYRDTSEGNPYGEYVRQAKNGHQMITIYREKGEDKITESKTIELLKNISMISMQNCIYLNSAVANQQNQSIT